MRQAVLHQMAAEIVSRFEFLPEQDRSVGPGELGAIADQAHG